jgi:hypothetical protein
MPAGSAGSRVLTSGVGFAVDDSSSINGVSGAAQAIALPAAVLPPSASWCPCTGYLKA